jgi:hypothetical protein
LPVQDRELQRCTSGQRSLIIALPSPPGVQPTWPVLSVSVACAICIIAYMLY